MNEHQRIWSLLEKLAVLQLLKKEGVVSFLTASIPTAHFR